ncbi:MAG: RelA/SpoT family protein [Porphyromonas sp.]|nr:RelA/SpoT family protein [Porphyromonas sp.]
MIVDQYTPAFSPEEEATIEAAYQQLINAYINSNHRRKVEVIARAFTLARIAHAGVRRRSGEPYILHPIAVAQIVCSEMGLGSTSIVCALLHDVVEDTDYTTTDIQARFGEKVATIVEGLTKVSSDRFSPGSSTQTESLRKILLVMSEDARVILIKIADRLHNMRTLGSMLPSKQYKIAGETQYIYAPLAHRLGLHSIKTELEDLSFKYEYPEEYQAISQKVVESEGDRENLLKRFASPIEAALISEGIQYDLKMRVKSNYSIWRKMKSKGVPFEEVYDLFAVRIVFDCQDGYSEVKRCFDIYTAITALYRSNSERVRDWVNMPKSNGYRALHVTVMGPDGRWIEVQIRSRRMDEIAEQGLAAHWRYKNELVEEDKEISKWLDTIREIVQAPTPNGMDFLDTMKLTLSSDEIYVFTPKGDTIRLPIDATALDLAYNIHSELGDHSIGAKVNHKVVPLSTKLSHGDQVEILHSRSSQPKSEWLNFVITAKARLGVQAALKRQQRDVIARGEELLAQKCQSVNIELSNSTIDRLLSFYQYKRREDFYAALGSGHIDLDSDIRKTLKAHQEQKSQGLGLPAEPKRGRSFRTLLEPEAPRAKAVIDRKKVYTLEESAEGLNYHVSACCHPIPGDTVLGIVDDEEEVHVHKLACPIATRIKSTEGNRLVTTHWGEHHQALFQTTLIFRGVDNVGILHSITQTLLEHRHININGINVGSKDGIFSGQMTLLVHNTHEVDKICTALKQHESIISIHRLAEETLKHNTK